jgi:hypothetical protein
VGFYAKNHYGIYVNIPKARIINNNEYYDGSRGDDQTFAESGV